MIITLNDTHLGVNAASHTTGNSSKALDEAIFKHALSASKRETKEDTVIHGGDLFHRFSNKESVILKGIEIAKNCDVVVGANHDLSNRDNVKSSIEIVNEIYGNVVMSGVNEVTCESFTTDCGTRLTIVPHHSSQDLFDKALLSADGGELLYLHCNFNNPFSQGDASLNLSIERADELLKKYTYIVLAHEHNHRWEMDGRLLVTGNTHPTNFGDISDKFKWHYLEGKFTSIKVWDKSTGYKRVTVDQLLNGFSFSGVNFIEIVGEKVDPELSPKISLAMKAIWDSCDDELYMLRNNVSFKTIDSEVVDKSVQLEDVVGAISKKLKDTDLSELWESHVSKELENA